MKKIFLLVAGISFAFSIEYVVLPKGQSLPGFNIEWTNQGNPKQMILEEYYIGQKFGLDEKSLRRREVHHFNPQGDLVALYRYGEGGTIEGMETNVNDAQGELKEKIRIKGLGDIAYKIVYTRTNIGKLRGLPMMDIRYNPDGSIHTKNMYDYDVSGFKTNQLIYNHTGFLEWKISFSNDTQGRILDQILRRGVGTPAERRVFVYTNGGLYSEMLFQDDNTPTGNLLRKTINTYASNNLSEQKIFKGNGDLRSATRFVYSNAGGLLSEKITRDASSAFIARVTFSYDASGRKTEEIWYKTETKPDSKITYAYDPKGNPLLLKRLKYSEL
ncbi:MAG: hypothetical protein JNM63_00795, partial [Spirochaetia bacterium]|nr:hypothetical protein [Spirochaetia bacterium]